MYVFGVPVWIKNFPVDSCGAGFLLYYLCLGVNKLVTGIYILVILFWSSFGQPL